MIKSLTKKNNHFLPPKGLHVERIIHDELHPAGPEHLEHGGVDVIITPVPIEIFIFVSVYDVPIQNQSGVSFIIQHLRHFNIFIASIDIFLRVQQLHPGKIRVTQN